MAVAVGLVGVATLARMGLGMVDTRITPFPLYFPAILLAALLGGWRTGLAATALATVAAWFLFLAPRAGVSVPLSTAVINTLLYAAGAGAVVALAAYVGRLVDRLGRSQDALAERTLHYDALFHTMSEGFALCEAIRDGQQRLIDYVVLEMNPAMQRMLGVGPDAVGGKLSAVRGDTRAWLKLCDRVLTTGAPTAFEYHNTSTDRWHEIHINRVTPTRMAQLFFDITERKLAQARQAELFDELNHRVKNNLTIVSSILNMQARGGDEALHAELMKAVARVQSIAAVHETLHKGNRAGEIDFGLYVTDLCERIANSLVADDRIRIMVDAESALVSTDQAVSMGIIVNELVTNAVKYAYPATEGGLVDVRFHRLGAGAVLSVGDAGRGLPPDFDGKDAGLGVRLLKSLVRQVGGELEVRDARPGAVFQISLPDMAKPAEGHSLQA